MSEPTVLSLTDSLPLTCSRTGTCCFGKAVWINPWELATLADAKGMSPREFRNQFCEFGGIKLKFNGVSDKNKLSACNLYVENFGCSVHAGRPLACRLFPLGLKRHGEQRYYIHNGTEFPCMNGCPEVVDLPKLTVGAYIEGQATEKGELAQENYLSLMETLADGAFALLIDSGLAESGDRTTIPLWRTMGEESGAQLARRIGSEWIERLMIPEIELADPVEFAKKHHDLLQATAQEKFGSLNTVDRFRTASVLMMGLALHLGRALGANPADLADQWIGVAKANGADE